MINKKVYSKLRLVVLLTISFQFLGFSQEVSTLNDKIKGFWVKHSFETDLYKDWDAQWIWLQDTEADVMLARKTFELSSVPSKTELKITASSKYQLYVNGVYVLQGPARSAPHHQSFDILDIASLLKEGKNTIAVRVHYLDGTTSYEMEGRAGLLAQLKIDGETIAFTDASWKVSEDVSWDNEAPQINRFQLFVNDRTDLSKKLVGWEQVNFDDAAWANAKPLLRTVGWPAQKKTEKATSLTNPWISLVPRDIPYLKESNVQPIALMDAYEVSESQFQTSKFEIRRAADKKLVKAFEKHLKGTVLELSPAENGNYNYLLFDFGEFKSGMPKLVVEGDAGTEIHVLSAPFVVGDEFTEKIVASDYHDIIELSGQKDSWQAMYFKSVRYMALAVKGNTNNLKIHFLGLHEIEYPFENKGSIATPDAPWIENFWEASANTIDVCTTDAFTDNYRERRQYAQTGYYAAMGAYFTYGDYELQKRYLLQVAQEQLANGLMPAYAPLAGSDYMVILDSNCLWLRSLHNYYLYSGDVATVEYLMPYADKLMSLLHSFTNESGLIEKAPYPYWLDHTLNDRRGANLCLNGHYLGALEDYSNIKKWLGDERGYKKYTEKSSQLRQALKGFWDQDNQLFVDALVEGELSHMFSEHANAMALACGVATQEQADLIAEKLLKKDNHNYIKRADGTTMVSPAMSYFLHEGLAKYGYETESLEMFNARFAKMLDENTNQTLWEEWWRHGTGRTGKFQERTRSDAQTESVFPPMLFVNHVLGVQVSKPGMREVVISKPDFPATKMSGEIPTPNGMLKIDWNTKKGQLILNVPSNTTAKLKLESFRVSELSVDGNKINLEESFLNLNQGEHIVEFN